MLAGKGTLAFDFDGVVTRPHLLKSEELKRLGYDIAPEHTERYYCTRRCGVPLEIYERAAYNANVRRLWEMPLEDGVRDVVARLPSRGIRSVIVTSRTKSELSSVETYLVTKGLKVDVLINTDRGAKVEAVRKVSPFLYIDDSPYKLRELAEGGVSCTLFLFRHIANQYWAADDACLNWREGTWQDVEAYIAYGWA